MSEIKSLSYIGFEVSDMQGWIEYATNVLGVMVIEREDGCVDLRIDDNAHRIRLHPGPADDLIYLGWEVDNAEALAAVQQRLTAAGVEVERATDEEASDRHCEQLVRFKDMDGLMHEVSFGPLLLTQVPFNSPRGIGAYVTGEQGLGHIVLNTPNSKEMEKFFVDVLGFRVSDYVHAELLPGLKIDLAFLRCNGRHHTLAITTAPMPMPKRVQHFMLELEDMNDVGSTFYLAKSADVRISMNLGKHSNDEMFSFYMKTPSDFDLEYGWGGLVVDENSWRVKQYNAPSDWGHELNLEGMMPPMDLKG